MRKEKPRKKKKSLRFLKCRSCGALHATKHRLKRCWECGSTKFKRLKNDEYWKAKSDRYHEATGRPRRDKGNHPDIDHFKVVPWHKRHEKIRARREAAKKRRQRQRKLVRGSSKADVKVKGYGRDRMR